MNIVPMKGLVEHNDGDVAHAAQIDEIFLRKRVPCLDGMPDD